MYFEKFTTKNGMLNVNGKDIISENVKIHKNYADLPFTDVLKALGFNVVWLNGNNAEIILNDKKYILNLAEVSFIEDGKNNNLILPPPGSRTYNCEVLEKELILDSVTVHSVMYLMKRKININIDHDKLIVYITEAKE